MTETKKASKLLALNVKNGAPGRIRTSDRLVRSQVLYPAELRARKRGAIMRRRPRLVKGTNIAKHVPGKFCLTSTNSMISLH